MIISYDVEELFPTWAVKEKKGDGMIYSVLAGLFIVLLIVAAFVVSYLVVAGLTYLVCLGFGWEWSWFPVLGVWAVCVLLLWIVSEV